MATKIAIKIKVQTLPNISGNVMGMGVDNLLLEDGFNLLLEDGVSVLLLE